MSNSLWQNSRMTLRASSLWAVLALASCHTSSTQNSPTSSSATPPGSETPRTAAPPPSAPAKIDGPPRIDTACKVDRDCVVAHIEVDGELACCDACKVTPGSRRWYSELELYCGSHTPSSCPPLACPMGPTHARCQAGQCIAEPSDGGFQPFERKCLPAVVCDEWAGCASAHGNEESGWYVRESSRVPRGSPAVPDRVAVVDGGAKSVLRLWPSGVVCLPHSVPPLFSADVPKCVDAAGGCREAPR